MIYSLRGKLIHTEPNLAVVECSGVGLACRTTSTSLDGLTRGGEVTFVTHMSVREDAIELFGFITAHELNCFKMLLSVSGLGPKKALAILSDMTPQDFALAVVSDDAKALSRCSGIGNKTAQLIILKLKDKLGGDVTDVTDAFANSPNVKKAGTGTNEALSALMVLGFSASESAAALSGIDGDISTPEKIKAALKKLSAK